MNRTQEVIKSHNEQVLYEDEISSKKKLQMFEKKTITLIAAAAQNDALGKDNDLIWHISEDLKRFKRLTTGHAIIMGRKTFESMPKALPNRTNIVLTKNENYRAEGAVVAPTIEEALVLAGEDNQPFIIGGAQIYSLFMDHCNRIELTRVHHDFEADVFFPKIDTSKWKISKEEFISKTEDQPYNYTYITYDKK